MKKLMTTTAMAVVLMASSFAVAKKPIAKEGMYVAVDVGYANLNPNGKGDYAQSGSLTTKKQKSASGFKTDLLVGYEAPCADDAILLGGELLAAMNTAETKTSQIANPGLTPEDSRSLKVKSKYTFGANFLVGTPFTDTVAGYLKLGVVYSKFQVKNINQRTTVAGGTDNKGVWGFAPGVRVKWAATDEVSVYGDVTYAMYKSFKSKDFDPGSSDFRAHLHPRELAVTVGVAYKF